MSELDESNLKSRWRRFSLDNFSYKYDGLQVCYRLSRLQEFDTSSCRVVWVLMNASIVLQVTFSRSDCNELWGLASIFPMVPKNRINNRVRVNEWTKAHVVQRLVSVLMNLESTQSWLKLSWRLNPLKKWPGHPISSQPYYQPIWKKITLL